MPDRITRLFRLAALVLLLGLAVRIALVFVRPNPLANLRIPTIPTLATGSSTTNTAASPAPTPPPGPTATATNLAKGASNAPGVTGGSTNSTGTNAPARPPGTNAPGTNGTAIATAAGAKPPGPPPTMLAGPGMPMMPGGPGMRGPGRGGPALDPLTQARLDRIIQSELLAPVHRPLPMALLGIAGTNAFLRTPSGMSGMLGEGGELGGIKLLRIGINRVLVDEGGTNKELTIFGGAGGQSLLPQPTSTP